jgi:SAM-dependent methyltransferase
MSTGPATASHPTPTAPPTEAERAAAAELLPMVWGIHISRAIYAAAELGIADLLAAGPLSSAELSRATNSHEPSLYRVLRLLAAFGVFTEREDRQFSLTLLGDRLRTGAPAGMRSWALLLETVGGVRPFEHILDTVRTGNPGTAATLGTDIFTYFAGHPQQAAAFDAAMSERTEAFAPSVAELCDFSDVRTVVDVGGGNGALLVQILRRHPHLKGIAFDVPTVAARAEAVLDAADLSDRYEVLAGDFFVGVPPGADCYILANVLHDWDDARATEILANCRRAMAKGGRVLIIERLIPIDRRRAVPAVLSDVTMLVITGGQERTNAEYGALLAAAGLHLAQVRPVAFPYGVLEGFSGISEAPA